MKPINKKSFKTNRATKKTLPIFLIFLFSISALMAVGCSSPLPPSNLSTIEQAATIHVYDPNHWLHQIGGMGVQRGSAVTTSTNGAIVYTVGTIYNAVDISYVDGPVTGPNGAQFDEKKKSVQAYVPEAIIMTKHSLQGHLAGYRILGHFPAGRVQDIKVDAVGNIYIAGYFWKEISLTPWMNLKGSSQVWNGFLAKFDKQGQIIWATITEGSTSNRNLGIHLSSGRILVTGSIAPNATITSYTSQNNPTSTTLNNVGGLVLSSHRLTNGSTIFRRVVSGAIGNQVTADSTGNIWNCGEFSGTFAPAPGVSATTSATQRDGFLARLAPNGTWTWAKALGGQTTAACVDVAVDDKEQARVVGYFYNDIHAHIQVLGRRAGSTGLKVSSSLGSSDVFTSLVSSAGVTLAFRASGGSGTDRPTGLAQKGGKTLITGYHQKEFYLDTKTKTKNLVDKGSYAGFLINGSALYGIGAEPDCNGGVTIPAGVAWGYLISARVPEHASFVVGSFTKCTKFTSPGFGLLPNKDIVVPKSKITSYDSYDIFIWKRRL